jgi:glycosyltransferase involved in cell wall biosynthesis
VTPFFSIIVPMYNRAAFIGRTLRSCLSQDWADFEIIVVDDASEDESHQVATTFVVDKRVKLFRHEKNRGRCPTRNTGMREARGEWFVFLDSDDELLPGALRQIHTRAVTTGHNVGAMRFMCRDEHGKVSPAQAFRNEVWDYGEYVAWLEQIRGQASESLPCSRASTFPAIRYPDDHSEEGLYHLDIAQRHAILVCSDVVRLYHDDAHNRVTSPNPKRVLQYAPDAAENAANVLARHGNMLQKRAPNVFADLLYVGAQSSLLAGKRSRGLTFARQYLKHNRSRKMYMVLGLGLLHARLLVHVQAVFLRLRKVALRANG